MYMNSFFDQETATYMYGQEQFAEGERIGERRGWEKGNEEGSINTLIELFKNNKLTANDVANYLHISVDDFLKLIK